MENESWKEWERERETGKRCTAGHAPESPLQLGSSWRFHLGQILSLALTTFNVISAESRVYIMAFGLIPFVVTQNVSSVIIQKIKVNSLKALLLRNI